MLRMSKTLVSSCWNGNFGWNVANTVNCCQVLQTRLIVHLWLVVMFDCKGESVEDNRSQNNELTEGRRNKLPKLKQMLTKQWPMIIDHVSYHHQDHVSDHLLLESVLWFHSWLRFCFQHKLQALALHLICFSKESLLLEILTWFLLNTECWDSDWKVTTTKPTKMLTMKKAMTMM